MTFRFEQINGRLYDFKGMDHILMMSVKYYTPKRMTSFDRYVLNPNYNDDYQEYMINKMMNDKKSREVDAVPDIGLYMREHNKYTLREIGDSDEEEEEDDTSSGSEDVSQASYNLYDKDYNADY